MPEHSQRNIIMLTILLALIILALMLFLPWMQFLVTTIALLMFIIPFLPAISELNFPKDVKQLDIDMMYYKNPFYFGDSFKKIITEAVESAKGVEDVAGPDYLAKLSLSHDEAVKLFNSDQHLSAGPYDNAVYVEGDLSTADRMMFAREIYATGKTTLGQNNIVRALYSEGNIEICGGSAITRWVCGKSDMTIGANCFLGRSAAAAGSLSLVAGVRFSSLYGNPVATFVNDIAEHQSLAAKVNQKTDLPIRWKVLKKGLLVSLPYDPDKKTDSEEADLSDLSKQITKNGQKQFEIKTEAYIEPDLIIKKDLLINEKVVCFGNLKGYQNIMLKNNVIIHGNIFAEGDIIIGGNCHVLGNIFSQGRIEIKPDSIIGQQGKVKSLIGKKSIRLSQQVLVYGYILTEGQGEII